MIKKYIGSLWFPSDSSTLVEDQAAALQLRGQLLRHDRLSASYHLDAGVLLLRPGELGASLPSEQAVERAGQRRAALEAVVFHVQVAVLGRDRRKTAHQVSRSCR